jgi:hypothetical protein
MIGRRWRDWRWRNILDFAVRNSSKRSRKSQYSPANHHLCKLPLSPMMIHNPNSSFASGHRPAMALMICYLFYPVSWLHSIGHPLWKTLDQRSIVSAAGHPSKEKNSWLKFLTYQKSINFSQRIEARWAVSIKYRISRKKCSENCRQTKKRQRRWHWEKHCASLNTGG